MRAPTWDIPDFRANGRIFATLHADERHGMVKLTPEEQREFMRAYPKIFGLENGAWGRQGCTRVRLDVADEATVRGALTLAWHGLALQPRRRPPSRPAKNQRAKRSATSRR